MKRRKKEKVIDGGLLEGGGQILRISTCLSSLLGCKIRIHSIRKNRMSRGRPSPGLRNQHLKGMEFLALLSSAKFVGGKVKSCEVEFIPSQPCLLDRTDYVVDAVTAGSIGLLIQVSLPCLIFNIKDEVKSVRVLYKGGTNVDFSPTYDYFESVFLPVLIRTTKLEGLETKLIRRGVGPLGRNGENGEVEITMQTPPNPFHLNPIILTERGELKKFYINTFVTGKVALGIAERLCNEMEGMIKKNFGDEVEVVKQARVEEVACGNFCQIMLIGETSTGCRFGITAKKGKKAKPSVVCRNVMNKFVRNWNEGGCVDEYLADQLIIYMALAKGESALRIGKPTMHTKTAIHFSKKMTGAKFDMVEQVDGSSIITVEGIGYTREDYVEM